ncbi:MAG: hypothetical protein LUC47_05150 [Clostridiales bacterium]|nr:hypothetical protein [Clostridiales bacterium]
MENWLEHKNNSTYIYIGEMFKMLFRKWKIILAGTLLCGILLFLLSCFIITPLY